MLKSRPKVLGVRLGSAGGVLLTGPALRALAAGSSRVDLLVSPSGLAAGRQLPGVDEVLVFETSWTGHPAPRVSPDRLQSLLELLRDRAYDHAVIFSSSHQSALPMALLARWAQIHRVSAMSEGYPGSSVDDRVRRWEGGAADVGVGGEHEVEAALRLAEAAGFPLPAGDDRRLRLKGVPPVTRSLARMLQEPYVVVHPRASVPSRSFAVGQAESVVQRLVAQGWFVILTGRSDTRPAPELNRDPRVANLTGTTSWADLTRILAGAACVVVGNTGAAHLAAAVNTPVVSLFSPVVPAQRWRPWGVPHVILGDQHAACRGSRALDCPTSGHPCIGAVTPEEVASAVLELTGEPPSRLGSARVLAGRTEVDG
ncbi:MULTISPECIES: glycosyltransferase family 9 protein [unclassified Knoellia]|uniref:glycosyltransferase family 9 protein n=1 Tax=Knoellia altitudinis TaxID=3404795 RepID=UPI0036164FB0